jgi:signal peptidase I
VARASVAGFLAVQGVLAGYWFSSAGGADPSLWMMVLLGAGGYFLGNGWRPRLTWSSEENGVLLRESLEWADTGFSAILLAAVIMYFVVQAFKIPSGSMRSTLLEGDHLFVNKFIYGLRVPYTGKRVFRFREVQRGDVVVFRFPASSKESQHYGKDFIKRAIGLPGDTIEIKDKRVFVNGKEQVEPYAQFEDNFLIPGPTALLDDQKEFQDLWVHRRTDRSPAGENVRDNFGPVVVPPGTYFVMGDNRDRSYDGRFWGPMPDSNLKGRAWLLYLPFQPLESDSVKKPGPITTGLYLHIPFCAVKCRFCDFAAFPGRRQDVSRYLMALQLELKVRFQNASRRVLSKLFTWEGEPPLFLDPAQWTGLVAGVRQWV